MSNSAVSKSIFGFLVISVAIVVSCNQPEKQAELPIFGNTIYDENDTVYHTIADFSLIDQDSNVVNNETFSGKVYVADFFFTSCPTICPTMKKEMLRVYQAYENDPKVGILSHTIDPKYDTVALLNDYAERLGVSSSKWKFVTGDKDIIYDLAEQSYISVVDEDSDQPGGFVHSGMFLLIDEKRRIRGVYDGTVSEQVDVLISDIKILTKP